MSDGITVVASHARSLFCIEDSRLRVWRLSAGFENESNAKYRCLYAFCEKKWDPCSFMWFNGPFTPISPLSLGQMLSFA